MYLIVSLITALIIIVPAWKIFKKAGYHPAWSLLIFIPSFGYFIAALILAFGDWPALSNQSRS